MALPPLIGGIYFAGYAIAVPFLTGATDSMEGRRLYVGSALLGAAASLVFAAIAHGFVLAWFCASYARPGVEGPVRRLLVRDGPHERDADPSRKSRCILCRRLPCPLP
jgi:hypothetical protein